MGPSFYHVASQPQRSQFGTATRLVLPARADGYPDTNECRWEPSRYRFHEHPEERRRLLVSPAPTAPALGPSGGPFCNPLPLTKHVRGYQRATPPMHLMHHGCGRLSVRTENDISKDGKTLLVRERTPAADAAGKILWIFVPGSYRTTLLEPSLRDTIARAGAPVLAT